MVFWPALASSLLITTGQFQLPVPNRESDAPPGLVFAKTIETLPQEAREGRMVREILSGNIPPFMRTLVPVTVSATIDGREVKGRIFVTPDYLSVGSDADYFLCPMTPFTAQRIADRLQCILPTPKIVDAIHSAASVKLLPYPIAPSSAMTTVPVFETHNSVVKSQRRDANPLGALVSGDKKDIVICRALADNPGRVAIYGWRLLYGKAIQPLYLGHFAYWADYSHGVRLVSKSMEVEGVPTSIEKVLADPKLSALLSDEGPISISRYRFKVFPHPDDPTIHVPSDEKLTTFSPVPGVRVVIDEPAHLLHKVRLVLYALPNGNTIEQTFGRRLRPDDDWHYDIQHIGAQTRFIRRQRSDESLVVAYVEASNHAWPAWIRSAPTGSAVQIVSSVIERYKNHDVRVVLDSHSGGGAFVFGYIDAVDQIPDMVDRIAFLDSEYNYDKSLHASKLSDWLRSDSHYLCAIAYDDASALLKGKPFVSAAGGTWGRSHAMLDDLGAHFPIRRVNSTDPERFEGLDGRIVFLLKENPKAEIFHTVQVERNGFIESLLSGTNREGKGYQYFGPRAYTRWIFR